MLMVKMISKQSGKLLNKVPGFALGLRDGRDKGESAKHRCSRLDALLGGVVSRTGQ